jgi:hypothetical protein
MLEPSDDILEQTRTREVTGVFHSWKALMAAAEELLLSGFDRADIDLSASIDELERRSNYASIPPVDLADTPVAARRPFLDQDDALGTTAVIGSISGCTAAVAVAFLLAVKDMTPLSVGIISVLSGFVVGGAAAFLVDRRFQRERAGGLEALSEPYGLLIWVRVRSPEKGRQAEEILLRHGGEAVHVHEIEQPKRMEDVPLHSLRPDPGWATSGSGSRSFAAKSRPARPLPILQG